MIELSIIIINFNTAKFIHDALSSIERYYSLELSSGRYEIIVVDNGSSDGSIEALRNYKKDSKIKILMLIDNKKNVGFAKANNIGIKKAKGRYILFLNPDTIMRPHTLRVLLDFMEKNNDAGAVGCRVDIPNNKIDEASHRGFPTPWNAFTHFSGLERMFPHFRLFAGYTRSWENMKKIHTVPAIVGAFMMVRKEAGEQIGWWYEDYFFYGEDLDFCYSLWERGWKIYYVPTVSILHIGGVSSGIKKHSQNVTTANIERKRIVQKHRFEAMRIFYKRHYLNKYPKFITWMVFKGINYLQKKNLKTLTLTLSQNENK